MRSLDRIQRVGVNDALLLIPSAGTLLFRVVPVSCGDRKEGAHDADRRFAATFEIVEELAEELSQRASREPNARPNAR